MFTAMRNIQKDKGVERTEFGETVAQSLFDLENTSNDLKSDLKNLYINSAVELEKKFSGKDVMPVTMQSPISPFFSSISTFDRTEPKLQTPKHNPSIPFPSVPRLWRPAAQRNIRTQWKKLFTLKQKWHSELLTGRSHATSLVNSYLSQSYMPSMNLGCLSDMPDIREKACSKLAKQQELHQKRLCASYKDMVGVVSDIVYASSSMRQFIKGPTNSPLVTFSSHRDEDTDNGDGGGIPVFKFLSIPYFENLANELVEMFGLELILKRMLVVELLSLSCEESSQNSTSLCWSDELYPGEFDDLAKCNLYSEENCEPIPPRINGWKSNSLITKRDNTRPDEKALEVYLVIWPQEVNVNPFRVGEIFDIVREEIPMISFI